MLQDKLDVRAGNNRRKQALNKLVSQIMGARADQGATLAASNVRQGGGLGRGSRKQGAFNLSVGRGVPQGLEGLYAKAADYAQQNLGLGGDLRAERQFSGADPGANASQYAQQNSPTAGGDTGAAPGVFQAPQLTPGTVVAPSGSGNALTGGAPGGTATTDPEHNSYIQGNSEVDAMNVQFQPTTIASGLDPAFATAIAAKQGAPTDGTPMNGGIYYQGTIIPIGVWNAMKNTL